jgi:hypothetical protein
MADVQNLKGEEIEKLSDKELHLRCQVCGSNIRKLQKEFACYLPEVDRRGLYKKYGFHSIHEYAARIAGMGVATVDAIMSVHKKLVDKPVLKDLMAESGWGKLRVVAAVATKENQDFWAEKIREMSKATLVTYLRELRRQEASGGGSAVEVQTGLFTDPENDSILGTGSGTLAEVSHKSAITFRLDSDIETKLRIFKQGLEKKTREPKDWNEVMKELLKIAAEHEDCGKRPKKTAAVVPEKSGQVSAEVPEKPVQRPAQIPAQLVTRHIPVHIKKQLKEKYGGKCAFPGCTNPAEINHHTKRFALEPDHKSIAPLCKDHERIAHLGLIENEEGEPEKWQLLKEPDRSLPKFAVDKIVQKLRAPVYKTGHSCKAPHSC